MERVKQRFLDGAKSEGFGLGGGILSSQAPHAPARRPLGAAPGSSRAACRACGMLPCSSIFIEETHKDVHFRVVFLFANPWGNDIWWSTPAEHPKKVLDTLIKSTYNREKTDLAGWNDDGCAPPKALLDYVYFSWRMYTYTLPHDFAGAWHTVLPR